MVVYFVWRPVSHRWPAALLPIGIGPHHPCGRAATSHVRVVISCTVVPRELMSRLLVCPTEISEPTFLDLARIHELASHRVGPLQQWSPLQLLY